MSERTYTEAEVALERAALLREAAEAVGKVKQGLGAGGHGAGMYTKIQIGSPICDAVNDAILDIPTDQSALARVEAAAYERGKQDAADLLYCEWTEGGGTSKNGTCPKVWWHSSNCKKCKILTLQDRGAVCGQ